VSTIASDLFGASPVFIPVITLWQPWASLCFVHDPDLRKALETRGYPPPLKYVGGDIAIHAAAAFPPAKYISQELNDLAYDAFGCGYNYSLPLGCILGLVGLSGGVPVETVRDAISDEERAAGDYSDGRSAWPLFNPRRFDVPVPAKGKQGWWRIEATALPELASVDTHAERGDAKQAPSARTGSAVAATGGETPNPVGGEQS
jgi:hypothetical protein